MRSKSGGMILGGSTQKEPIKVCTVSQKKSHSQLHLHAWYSCLSFEFALYCIEQ